MHNIRRTKLIEALYLVPLQHIRHICTIFSYANTETDSRSRHTFNSSLSVRSFRLHYIYKSKMCTIQRHTKEIIQKRTVFRVLTWKPLFWALLGTYGQIWGFYGKNRHKCADYPIFPRWMGRNGQHLLLKKALISKLPNQSFYLTLLWFPKTWKYDPALVWRKNSWLRHCLSAGEL